MLADKKKEDNARAAGLHIRQRKFHVENVFAIAYWKSPRSSGLTKLNVDPELSDILSIAISNAGLKEKIYALGHLSGVGIPVASAILTMIDEDKFTPIDVRVLDSLGEPGRRITFELYREYLDYCRNEAARLEVPLRVLDRALWKAGAA